MNPRALIIVLVNVALTGTAVVERRPDDEHSTTKTILKTEEGPGSYGYRDGEVTQGVGYGHHLHPFYYQGKMVKFYDCAKEDDWKPFDTQDHQEKKSKPVKKYDPSADKTKSRRERTKLKRIQPRWDGVKMPRRMLEQDHAKLLMDINAMSDDRPLKYRGKLLIDSDAIFDQPIRAAEPDEIALLEDLTYLSGHRAAKHAIEHAHRFNKVPFEGVPFQRYKKFKVIAVNPTVHYKFVKMPQKPYEFNIKPEGHPYPFVNAATGEAYQKPREVPLPIRTGRHIPTNVIVPKLTMLEQFLLLFPKLI